MKITSGNIWARLAPFLAIGVLCAIAVIGFILLWYVLIIGAAIGLVLFLGFWVKETFFPTKQIMPFDESGFDKEDRFDQDQKRRGRTYDHDEIEK